MFVSISAAVAFALSQQPAPSSPEDPFSDEYVVPSRSEVGVGDGQTRMFGLFGVFADGPGWVARGTTEHMASAFFGVRGSLEWQFGAASEHGQLSSARAGAGLHFFPYRVIDVGVFFEAGPAVSLASRRTAPLLVGGLSANIGLSTMFFFHLEAQFGWATVPGAPVYRRPSVLAGFGVTL